MMNASGEIDAIFPLGENGITFKLALEGDNLCLELLLKFLTIHWGYPVFP